MLFSVVFIIACIQSLDCQIYGRPEISRLNFFDTDLLRYTAEDKRGNVMVSPASIKSTLAMILEGASGETAAEIRSALRLSPDKDEFREQLNLYLSALKADNSGVTLQNANAIFVSTRLKLKKDYEVMLRKVYFSEVNSLDFTDPINAADVVNKWISQNTKGLIPNIVRPDDINPTSDSLLTNALYFKAAWRTAFNPRYTRPGCFQTHGRCLKVAMMELHEQMKYAYVDNLRSHALELPYEGGRFSMILLVPHDREGLATLIRDIPYMSLPQISQLMELSEVRLFMPKFTVDYSESMIGPLRSMKITSLFTKNATLNGMFETASSQVNNIIHKVFVSVDEAGTVAAAASSAMVIPLIEDGVQLKVDRPFVFFIRDNHLGLILFEGKIEEPTKFDENVVDPTKTSRRYQIHF